MVSVLVRISSLALIAALGGAARTASPSFSSFSFELRSLDGSNNNRAHPTWGQIGTSYQRLASARYGDGQGSLSTGPNPRYISNRVLNALGVDLFSERNVSQW